MAANKKNKSNKTRRRLIILGVVAYALFLIASLPASFMVDKVLAMTKTSRLIKLNQVQGTVWEGQALDSYVGKMNLGNLKWELSPWGILLGDADLDVHFSQDNAQGRGEISVGFGGSIEASDVTAEFPVELIQQMVKLPFVHISGLVTTEIEHAEFVQDEILKLEGIVVWQDALIKMPNIVELGDITITMAPYNQGTRLKISDQETGPVAVDVTIDIFANGRYKMNGNLTPRDTNQQDITEALKFIGKPDNTGRYWVSYNGTLSNKRR